MLFNPGRLSLGKKGDPSLSRPPDNLYLPRGGITSAWKSDDNPFAGRRSRHTDAQKVGLAYERRVGEWLGGRADRDRLLVAPWFAYCDGSGKRRYCQPDFLLEREGGSGLVIIEVKTTWSARAWWQLRKLYQPVLSIARPGISQFPLCICRTFDPATATPEPPHLIRKIEDADLARFNVLVFR